MRTRVAAFTPLIAIASGMVLVQVAAQSPPSRPTFEVVSIRRAPAGPATRPMGSGVNHRPDGGFTMTNVTVATLISLAYPPAVPVEMVGLPRWATSERFDVSATSSLARATPDDRMEMLRAMLADRFRLLVRLEKRERPAFDLVLARDDARLGSGISRSDVDCHGRTQDRVASDSFPETGTRQLPPQRPDFTVPPPPCALRTVAEALRETSLCPASRGEPS